MPWCAATSTHTPPPPGIDPACRSFGSPPATGTTAVRTAAGVHATPEEDGNVFVRLTATTPATELSGRLVCDWRPGEVW